MSEKHLTPPSKKEKMKSSTTSSSRNPKKNPHVFFLSLFGAWKFLTRSPFPREKKKQKSHPNARLTGGEKLVSSGWKWIDVVYPSGKGNTHRQNWNIIHFSIGSIYQLIPDLPPFSIDNGYLCCLNPKDPLQVCPILLFLGWDV